jgi:hypothetical protein
VIGAAEIVTAAVTNMATAVSGSDLNAAAGIETLSRVAVAESSGNTTVVEELELQSLEVLVLLIKAVQKNIWTMKWMIC